MIYSIEIKDGKNMFLVYDSESKRLLHEFELDKFDLAKLIERARIELEFLKERDNGRIHHR